MTRITFVFSDCPTLRSALTFLTANGFRLVNVATNAEPGTERYIDDTLATWNMNRDNLGGDITIHLDKKLVELTDRRSLTMSPERRRALQRIGLLNTLEELQELISLYNQYEPIVRVPVGDYYATAHRHGFTAAGQPVTVEQFTSILDSVRDAQRPDGASLPDDLVSVVHVATPTVEIRDQVLRAAAGYGFFWHADSGPTAGRETSADNAALARVNARYTVDSYPFTQLVLESGSISGNNGGRTPMMEWPRDAAQLLRQLNYRQTVDFSRIRPLDITLPHRFGDWSCSVRSSEDNYKDIGVKIGCTFTPYATLQALDLARKAILEGDAQRAAA